MNTEFSELLRKRRSCRQFTKDSVDEAMLKEILEHAQSSATWCNTQPWHLYLLQGELLKSLGQRVEAANSERLPVETDISWPDISEEPYISRKRCTDKHVREELSLTSPAAIIDNINLNMRFLDAPQAFVISSPRDLMPYSLVDIGCYLTSLQYSMSLYGLAGCPQVAQLRYTPLVRKAIGAPSTEVLVCCFPFGVPEVTPPSIPKADIKEVLTIVGFNE